MPTLHSIAAWSPPQIYLHTALQRIKEERNMLWPLTGYLPFVSNSHLPAKQPKLHGRRFLGDMMAVWQRKEEIRTRFHIKYLGLFLFKHTRGTLPNPLCNTKNYNIILTLWAYSVANGRTVHYTPPV